nr:DUF5447 family protein [Pseudomonas citronellolis]
MQLVQHLLFRPHAPDCDCSVCFVARQGPVLPSLSACADCQLPGRPYQVDGRWYCRPVPSARNMIPGADRLSTGTLSTTAASRHPSYRSPNLSSWRAEPCRLTPPPYRWPKPLKCLAFQGLCLFCGGGSGTTWLLQHQSLVHVRAQAPSKPLAFRKH